MTSYLFLWGVVMGLALSKYKADTYKNVFAMFLAESTNFLPPFWHDRFGCWVWYVAYVTGLLLADLAHRRIAPPKLQPQRYSL